MKEVSVEKDGEAKMKMNNSPIQMEWFHNLEGEKTKFNWFLLEIALEYYSRINESSELKAYRKQYSKKEIALYCTYYAT
jgi:purine nucleoside permease